MAEQQNRVAGIRRGLGIPDDVVMRHGQVGPGPAQPDELTQALQFRKGMLAQKVVASTYDELDQDLAVQRAKQEADVLENEVKAIELRQKRDALVGQQQEGQVSILNNVIGLLASEKAEALRRSDEMQARLFDLIERQSAEAKEDVLARLAGNGAGDKDTPATFADRMQELISVRDLLRDLFPAPAAAQPASSVSEAIQMMRINLENERMLAEMRRTERLDADERERKLIQLSNEQKRNEVLAQALQNLPSLAASLMSKPNGNGSTPAPPANGNGIQEVPAQSLGDGGFAIACPKCQSPLRVTNDQTTAVCPNGACRELITIHR